MASTEVPGTTEWTFSDPALEKLYRSHSSNQKRTGLQCFLLGAILFDLYTLVVPLGQHLVAYIISGICLGLAVIALVWCRIGFSAAKCQPIWQLAPHFAWHLFNAQLLLHLFVRSYLGSDDVTARDCLGWALLLVYLVYVTLPLRLRYCVMLSLGTCASYVVALVGLSKSDKNIIEQHLANCILLLAANVFGLMSYFLEDAQQRKAFLETRQSLQVKLVIEEQSAEQERLLLSVLPEHVAVKMRQDLGSTDSQFKKIYMSRHENVSILYADIVGFTAISSTYSAQDLVKILNELFARFDRLAEKYQQLRIKILGDCYYCISGAPVERPDHAVLCVHMGLSMVKAIKYVQQTTNSPVDMRVGIHTGAVLAGVLGQRQWQFDVYSKDVELANKMESSGMAGRVHISHQTLSFLDGEFEVEPAHGEKREEALRMAGIKTYFIVKVLKPYSTPIPEIRNGAATADPEETILAEGLFDTKDESKCNSPIAEESQAREDSDDFKNRLRTELISRDGHRELQKRTSRLTLRFRSSSTERQYDRHREPLSAIPLLSLPLAAVAALVSQWIAVPLPSMEAVNLEKDQATKLETAVSIAVTVILAVITLGAAAETAPRIFPRCLVLCSRALNDSMYVRRVIAILGIIMLAVANTINMSACDASNIDFQKGTNCTARQLAAASTDRDFLPVPVSPTIPSGFCNHPSYFSCSAALCLVTAAILPQLSHLTKAILMTLVTAIHCALNLVVLDNRLDCEDMNSNRDWSSFTPGKLTLSYMLIAVTIALSYLARHMERVSRVSFLWKTSVTEQREKASDMRQRNEALVYNVLPPHVAAHFMGQRKRQHDELYSQSYAEVGVLFASMPNFSDFYSEETVNNQGLECLRFLNEVISDFDALLELPQFKDIIKIKTIGSTYMAASGLKPTDIVQSPNAPITTRWAHLALLVDFALELKRALQCINEQSFNHFVLKMGVNHGPITAGVIGARKPHYDIWGNTVNVASRMESTGKAGAIQVTEETCDILQHFGYTFEQRGLVAVKGKGQLMTYYLQGKTTKPPASPLIGLTTMETLKEEDELCQGDSDNSPVSGFNAASPGSVRLCPSNSTNLNIKDISIVQTNNIENINKNIENDIKINITSECETNDMGTDDANAALITTATGLGDAESDALLPKDN